MAQSPASAVQLFPRATLRKIVDLAAQFGPDDTGLLDTSGDNQIEMLRHLAAVSAEMYLTTTIALETSGVGLPLPAVPHQRRATPLPAGTPR